MAPPSPESGACSPLGPVSRTLFGGWSCGLEPPLWHPSAPPFWSMEHRPVSPAKAQLAAQRTRGEGGGGAAGLPCSALGLFLRTWGTALMRRGGDSLGTKISCQVFLRRFSYTVEGAPRPAAAGRLCTPGCAVCSHRVLKPSVLQRRAAPARLLGCLHPSGSGSPFAHHPLHTQRRSPKKTDLSSFYLERICHRCSLRAGPGKQRVGTHPCGFFLWGTGISPQQNVLRAAGT